MVWVAPACAPLKETANCNRNGFAVPVHKGTRLTQQGAGGFCPAASPLPPPSSPRALFVVAVSREARGPRLLARWRRHRAAHERDLRACVNPRAECRKSGDRERGSEGERLGNTKHTHPSKDQYPNFLAAVVPIGTGRSLAEGAPRCVDACMPRRPQNTRAWSTTGLLLNARLSTCPRPVVRPKHRNRSGVRRVGRPQEIRLRRARRRETGKGRRREGELRTHMAAAVARVRDTRANTEVQGTGGKTARTRSVTPKNLPIAGGAPRSYPYPRPSIQGGESICEWTGDKRGRRTQKNPKTRAGETARSTHLEPAGRIGRRTRGGGAGTSRTSDHKPLWLEKERPGG